MSLGGMLRARATWLRPAAGRLAGRPHLHLPVLIGGGGVHRLQRAVGEEWICVVGLEDFGGALERSVDVAIAAQCAGGRRLQQFGRLFVKLARCFGPRPGQSPIDLEFAARELRLPPGVGHDRHSRLHAGATITTPGSMFVSAGPQNCRGVATIRTLRTPGSFLISSRLALFTLPP